MKIKYADGRISTATSLDDALKQIGSDVHTTDDFGRTLVWETEEDASGDDGANAVAEVIEEAPR